MNNHPFLPPLINKSLFPPASYKKIRHTKYYIKHGNGPKSNRKIYCRTPYDDFEKKKIQECKEYILAHKIEIPSHWNDSDLLKMLYTGSFVISKTVEAISRNCNWLRDPEYQTFQPGLAKYINGRYIYSIGRDKQFRPIVYMHMDKIAKLPEAEINEGLKAACYMMSSIRASCFVPGYIENWIIILETNFLGVFGFPYGAMKKIANICSLNYSGSLHKMYFLNPSITFNAIYNFGKSLAHPDTVAKMQMLKKNHFKDLLIDIEKDQLLEEYGGTLKCPPTLWPVPNTLPSNSEPKNDPLAEKENNLPIIEDEHVLIEEKSKEIHHEKMIEEKPKEVHQEKQRIENIIPTVDKNKSAHQSDISKEKVENSKEHEMKPNKSNVSEKKIIEKDDSLDLDGDLEDLKLGKNDAKIFTKKKSNVVEKSLKINQIDFQSNNDEDLNNIAIEINDNEDEKESPRANTLQKNILDSLSKSLEESNKKSFDIQNENEKDHFAIKNNMGMNFKDKDAITTPSSDRVTTQFKKQIHEINSPVIEEKAAIKCEAKTSMKPDEKACMNYNEEFPIITKENKNVECASCHCEIFQLLIYTQFIASKA